MKNLNQRSNEEFLKKLQKYSLLTGAALVAAPTVQGSVVQTNVNQTLAYHDDYNVNFDGGANRVRIRNAASHTVLRMTGGVSFIGYVPGGNLYISALNHTKNISTGANWRNMDWGYLTTSEGTHGAWQGVSDKFMGVRFKIGVNTHYGWVQMSNTMATITVHAYAYETTPNIGISAPLPVRLSAFTASYAGNSVVLNWSTESELNAVGFIIERKAARETDWQKIASYQTDSELVCLNNQIGNAEYNYTDAAVLPGESYTYRLSDVDAQGNVTILKEIAVSTVTGMDLQTSATVPGRTELLPAYPNPFNPETTIDYHLANDEAVDMAVFNINGQRVRQLVSNVHQVAGKYTLTWDARNDDGTVLPSGVYMIVLRAGDVAQTQKVILMK